MFTLDHFLFGENATVRRQIDPLSAFPLSFVAAAVRLGWEMAKDEVEGLIFSVGLWFSCGYSNCKSGGRESRVRAPANAVARFCEESR
jgi:hypothetical protein